MKLTACLITSAFLLLAPFRSISQLFIDNSVNATDGVQTVLLGNGVTATGISFAGAAEQIGSFNAPDVI
jgi:multisubunit Na+/H+ antiporter MnhB subunit